MKDRFTPLADYLSEAAYIYSDSDDEETMYKTRTENNSATYKSTRNPNLDFFFHVTPDTSPQTLITKLESSWAHNPVTTLKLICNLRGIRGTGKTDKESFYTCVLCLHNNHAKTLVCNIPVLVEFGYFKDLLEILYRLVEGEDVRKVAKELWMAKKMSKGKGRARRMYFLNKEREKKEEIIMKRKRMARRGRRNNRRDMRVDKSQMKKTREERVKENRKQMEKNKYEAKMLRKQIHYNNIRV
ncbi:plant/T31B5-30 protein [Tanacetum coccineum]